MTIKHLGGIFGRNPTFNEVTADGNFYANDNIIMADGKGIDFSATSGTGTSELFDDYEEGTWTPSIGGSSVAGTYETSTAAGYYTKVGRLVTVNFILVLDSSITAGGSGALIVSGLPYSCANTYAQTGTVLMERVDYSATATHVVSTFRTDTSSQLILTEVNPNLNDSSVNISDVAAGDLIACTVTYHTA